MIVRATCALAILSSAAPRLHAQDHRLGSVHFENSCAPATQATFDRAIALLHSFEFAASTRAFDEVISADSTCAMAWWGIALNTWTNPMVPNLRPTALLKRGSDAVSRAKQVEQQASARERAYIDAVANLYAAPIERDQRTRVLAYAQAMESLASAFPQDTEAQVFYAIALVGAASPTDKSYEKQLRAGAILERLFASKPYHPGLAHYIIHTYDVPALANRATRAATRYADIAPAAAHALHMPSHTFTRIGRWRESVKTNLRSHQAALRAGSTAEALHAADYAVYANLQLRRSADVRAILQTLPEIARGFDPTAVTGAAPGSAGVFALAAMPARYALERNAWREATALPVRVSAFPYADALTYFAHAIGFARLGDTTNARIAVDSIELMRTRLEASGEAYWAEQVAIQGLSASAWIMLAAGRADTAEQQMRIAADREDATEKAAVSPGPLAPARELLGDMLMQRRRPVAALRAYRGALSREPNRYRSLDGARRAAVASGNSVSAAEYARLLTRLTKP